MAITLILRNILLFPFLFSILIFFRSRFLHVWSLENKRLLHVIQLPARVRLVRQLEFISNSFDGGSSQVSIHQFFLLFLVSIKVNQLWNWIRCPSEFGDECYLLWLYRSSLNQQLLLVINNWLIMAWFNYYKIKWIMSSRFLSHDGWWSQSPNKLLRVNYLIFLFKSSICLEVVSNWTGSFFKSFFLTTVHCKATHLLAI